MSVYFSVLLDGVSVKDSEPTVKTNSLFTAVFVALAMAASRKAGTSPESASGVLALLGSSQNH